MQRRLVAGFYLCFLFSFYVEPVHGAPPVIDQYVSTGDSFFVGSFLPMDSEAAIEASFDLLKDVYGTRRIYWRGLQETLYTQSVPRIENTVINGNIEQSRHLINDLNLNDVAVQAARDRGMEIWGVSAMYEWGSAAEDPVFFGYPGDYEHPLRVDNPEWAPVDKYGVRTQGGPLDFSYADAREAAVDWYAQEVQNADYDGVLFHTFHENFTLRFPDEFGFNDPIVNEFQQRYGVDIRKENFNRQDWYDLRGEYTTQFLGELHDELSAQGKKLSVGLNPLQSDIPQFWIGSDFPVAGNITHDWRGWAANGIVDGLMVWGTNDIVLNNVLDDTQGTWTFGSLLTTEIYDTPALQPFLDAGVPITGFATDDHEYLLRSNIPTQPLSALSDPDVYKRMRVLAQIIDGQTTASVAQITPALSDSNLLTRRLALRALGRIGDASGLPLIEQALLDPESSIRTAAVYALIDANRVESVTAILNSVDQYGSHGLMEGAVAVLKQRVTSAADLGILTQATEHANPKVRSVAMRALAAQSSPSGSMLAIYINALNDSEPYVRAFAADGLANANNSAQAIDALVQAAASQDSVVSSRAATSLSRLLRRNDAAAESRRTDILSTLENLYRQFGDGSTRADKDWAYRPVGNALIDVGPDGVEILRSLMNQRTDRRVSEFAWKTLHLEQRPGGWVLVSEEDDAYAHFKRPRWNLTVAQSDSFNTHAVGTTIDGKVDSLGQVWAATQGDANDQVVQSDVANGGNALRVTRRLGGFHEVRISGDTWDAAAAEISTVTAKADWLRLSDQDVTAFGIDIGPGIEAQFLIDGNSFYRVWESDGTAFGGQYLQTGVKAGINGWETVEIIIAWSEADGATLNGTYDVYLSRDAENSLGELERTLIADDIVIHSLDERIVQELFISNQPNGISDVTTYWDNVSLTIGPVLGVVPEPGSLAMLCFGYSMILRRRRNVL